MDIVAKHVFAYSVAMLLVGCEKAPETQTLPRPVTVFRLELREPGRLDRRTGSVASWKTEQLSFEVGGRVLFVAEPETDIEGQIYGFVENELTSTSPHSTSGTQPEQPEGQRPNKQQIVITEGHEIARIDDSRYRLKVKGVRAQINTARSEMRTVESELEAGIPAELKAAEAELEFAAQEFEIHKPLYEKKAISLSEFNATRTNRDAAEARVEQVKAKHLTKRAERDALDARLQELQVALEQAQRNVDDCVLFSPFRGQVAEVHVIPGGNVQAGQPVLTVQMMDPIKVELEVSADLSRSLKYRDAVKVFIPRGFDEFQRDATVHSIAPVADPATRTFTVTLLLKNEKVRTPIPDRWNDRPLVRTHVVWRAQTAPYVKEGAYFVESNSIQSDDNGHFLWKITNWDDALRKRTPLLQVAKLPVRPGKLSVPFLGLWTFREVEIQAEDFQRERDWFVGELSLPDNMDSFAGGQILLDRQQWLLRPGDLVSVDLSRGAFPPAYYVPMDSISKEKGKYFVFAVPSTSGDAKVRRIEVQISDAPGTMKRVESTDLSAGMYLVKGGVHYIQEGQRVRAQLEH